MNSEKPWQTSWGMGDEMGFIRRLGSWRASNRMQGRPASSRLPLLEGYRAGLRLRTRTGGLDVLALDAFAAAEISRERIRGAA